MKHQITLTLDENGWLLCGNKEINVVLGCGRGVTVSTCELHHNNIGDRAE